MKTKPKDKSPAEIKFLLAKKGWTLKQVEEVYGLRRHIASVTLQAPHFEGEMAIAEILGLSPRQIWPSRYRADGTRHRPQPADNYKQRPRSWQCLKGDAA